MKLERITTVLERTAISHSRLYRMMQAGDFPRPKRIGKRAVAWESTEIDAWIDSRPIGGSWWGDA